MVLDSDNDVDPTDMTAHSEAVSNSNRSSSGTKGKKSIQVYVSPMLVFMPSLLTFVKPFGTSNQTSWYLVLRVLGIQVCFFRNIRPLT